MVLQPLKIEGKRDVFYSDIFKIKVAWVKYLNLAKILGILEKYHLHKKVSESLVVNLVEKVVLLFFFLWKLCK